MPDSLQREVQHGLAGCGGGRRSGGEEWRTARGSGAAVRGGRPGDSREGGKEQVPSKRCNRGCKWAENRSTRLFVRFVTAASVAAVTLWREAA
eukprot:2681925-Pleurochrysis_carterae.AAC.1